MKEVYFYKYCPTCVYKDVPETEEPCNECMYEPSAQDTHKPVKYVEKVTGK